MSTGTVRYPGRLVTALCLVLGLLLMATPQAQAGLSLCRSDPVVQLSDGSQVTLYADIAAYVSDIENIHYELRVPAGLSVLSVEHPDPQTAHLETFSFANDAPQNEWIAYTTVTLLDGSSVKVRAYMEVEFAGATKVRSLQKTGTSGNRIEVSLKLKKARS